MSVASRLDEARERVAAAARAVGRDPRDVTIVAVAKRQPLASIWAAHEAGQRDFGESTAQGLERTAEAALAGGRVMRWHFVGRLQTNKVKQVLRHATIIHSVDRIELAEEISKRAPESGVEVLLQVNIGEEAQKGGVAPGQALSLADAIAPLPRVRIVGLMAIPPVVGDPAPHFQRLATLRDELLRRPSGSDVQHLSMGMSEDYETAVRCGATFVRIGTAIFGERGDSRAGVSPCD